MKNEMTIPSKYRLNGTSELQLHVIAGGKVCDLHSFFKRESAQSIRAYVEVLQVWMVSRLFP
jgi:hypothetical protein